MAVNADRRYEIARILLDNDIVQLRPDTPFTYASGRKGPIYCDNRMLLSYPEHRRFITTSFVRVMVKYDIIAGTATAGIPWAAWLADLMGKPMIYVRSAAKEHGKQNRIEGILRAGQRVILIEDLINTGGSAVSSIDAIREAGGIVDSCLAIVDYHLQDAKDAFQKAGCAVYALTDLEALLEVARKTGKLSAVQCDIVLRWQKDPVGWATREGLA